MATTSYTTGTLTNNATFQTFCTNVHNAILAVGLVQTADTGQMNPATVTWPNTTNTKATGYLMYSFNDALQASYPCYIRVELGCGSGGVFPGIWITVGTSTDGAGVLGTIKTLTIQTGLDSASVTTLVSGTTSRLTISSCHTSNNSARQCLYTVERLLDANGANTNTGLAFVWLKNYGGTNTASQNGNQVLYFSGSQPVPNLSGTNWSVGLIYYYVSGSYTWANSNKTYLALVYPVGKVVHHPVMGLVCYYNADISPYSSISISRYGTNRNYSAAGASSFSTVGFDGGADVSAAVLYE